MNTLRTARGFLLHLASVRRRLVAIGLVSLALAACGGSGSLGTHDPRRKVLPTH